MGCEYKYIDGNEKQCPYFEDYKLSEDEWCIFHAPLDKSDHPHIEFSLASFRRYRKEKLADFSKKYSKLLSSYTLDNNLFDFEGFIFPKEFQFDCPEFFALSNKNFNFKNCSFYGDINLNKTFEFGEVNFEKSIFYFDIKFENTIFKEKASFKNCIFNGTVNFVSVVFKQDVSFKNSKINKLGNALNNIQFLGKASFTGVEFPNYTLFSKITFNQIAIFQSAIFKKGVSFHDVNFNYSASFIYTKINSLFFLRTTFKEDLFFYNHHFEGKVHFNDVTLNGSTKFSNCEFNKDFKFENIACNSQLDFINTTFNDTAKFRASVTPIVNKKIYKISRLNIDNVTVKKPIEFSNYILEDLSYNKHSGESIRFNNCDFLLNSTLNGSDCSKLQFYDCDLSDLKLLGCNLRYTQMDNIKFKKDKNDYYQIAGHPDNIKDKKNVDDEKIRNLRSIYRQLKVIFEESHGYLNSGQFHYREMELRQEFTKRKGLNIEHCFLRVYKATSDYGENYKKVGKWIIGLPFIFSAFIWLIEPKGIYIYNFTKFHVPLFDYLNTLKLTYYSSIPLPLVKTFKVMDNLTPLSEILLILNSLTTLSLVTLFIMAIRRKFKR